MTSENDTADEIIDEVRELRDHYDRGWVDNQTQQFIDHLNEIIEQYDTPDERPFDDGGEIVR